jgi:hypothetical protein
MTNKSYIGKGKSGQFNSVRVTVQMEKAEQHIYEIEGKKFLTFFVAEMKEADANGRTHTVYCMEKEQAEPAEASAPAVPVAATAKKNGRKKL